MNGLFSNPALLILIETLTFIFVAATAPTRFQLILTFLSMCAINECKSVRFMHQHFHRSLTERKLNSLYAVFNEARIDLSSWISNFSLLLIQLIPEGCSTYPIYLVIDDTLIEKVGTHFEGWAKLFDHVAHNGTSYLNGHCIVTLVVELPLQHENGVVRYVRVPLQQKLWIPKKNKGKENESDKESIVPGIPYKTKYELLREILELSIRSLGENRSYVLLADSWYPKGEILEFVNDNANVEAVFNVPINTVIYSTEVPQPTGKRGRPREIGNRLSPKKDFSMIDIPGTGYRAGWRDVTTNLFGKKKCVRALVTESKEQKSRRLFICTDPDKCTIPAECITDKTAKAIIEAIPEASCFACYSLRWAIEVTYLEQKTHWGLSEYMLRSVTGIERLINLQSMVYAVLCVLPWLDPVFESLKELSVQERRYEVGKAINQDLFLRSFAEELENQENSEEFMTTFCEIADKIRCFAKTGT